MRIRLLSPNTQEKHGTIYLAGQKRFQPIGVHSNRLNAKVRPGKYSYTAILVLTDPEGIATPFPVGIACASLWILTFLHNAYVRMQILEQREFLAKRARTIPRHNNHESNYTSQARYATPLSRFRDRGPGPGHDPHDHGAA